MSQPPYDPTTPSSPALNYYSPASATGFNWNDFLAFRTMITVPIIKFLFLFGVVIALIVGLAMLIGGLVSLNRGGGTWVLIGLLWLLLGPLTVRIYCEIFIVVFRINETLTEIKRELERRA